MAEKNKNLRTHRKSAELNPFSNLNRNIEALAAHLCAYADVLKQCSTRPAQSRSI